MILTNRKLCVLVVLAAAMLAATIVAYSYKPARASTFEKGSLLIQGLELPQIVGIKLRADGKAVELQKQGEEFVVVQRQKYPAAMKEINDLLIRLTDIRGVDKVADSTASHAELGVADDGKSSMVELTGKDGKKLQTLWVGQNAKTGGNYVRLAGSDAVYSVAKPLWLMADPITYIQTRLLNASKDDILKVTVTEPAGKYTIDRSKDGKAALQSVPAGKQVKQTEVDGVFEALTDLSFEDVSRDDKSVAWTQNYTCQLKGGLTYQLRLGKKADKQYVTVQAIGPSNETLEKNMTFSKTESKEELAKKDAVIQAAQKAEQFNARHGGWVYQLADWKAKNLARPMADLVENVSNEPKEVAASHILLSFKGSDRSTATRSKDEARALAQEVLTKALAPNADFAALAKQYSDCPSKDKGGDLGTFPKTQMDPKFSEAAWKLKVGEITKEIVETPFGFHVIKRTK